jgi:hypothetical protein
MFEYWKLKTEMFEDWKLKTEMFEDWKLKIEKFEYFIFMKNSSDKLSWLPNDFISSQQWVKISVSKST